MDKFLASPKRVTRLTCKLVIYHVEMVSDSCSRVLTSDTQLSRRNLISDAIELSPDRLIAILLVDPSSRASELNTHALVSGLEKEYAREFRAQRMSIPPRHLAPGP